MGILYFKGNRFIYYLFILLKRVFFHFNFSKTIVIHYLLLNYQFKILEKNIENIKHK